MSADLQGKNAVVFGVANKRSIAWAIARRLAEGGAQLAFTYQGERIESGVRELASSVDSPLVTECDVRSDEDVRRVNGSRHLHAELEEDDRPVDGEEKRTTQGPRGICGDHPQYEYALDTQRDYSEEVYGGNGCAWCCG